MIRVPSDLPAPGARRQRLILDVDVAVLDIADRLRQHWAAHAAAAGLSVVQVKVLLTLVPGDAVPMRSLAAALDYDTSNLSTLIDRLERRGTVERRPDATDRRVKTIALTKHGEEVRAGFWRDLIADDGPLATLTETDLMTFSALLAKLDPDSAST